MEPTTIIGDKLFDIAKDTGIISSIKNKLINDPGIALEKLEIVIEEISKIYLAISTEFANYLALYFDKDDEHLLNKEIKTLNSFKKEDLEERLNNARGHCGKITYIYRKHLNKWFSKLLAPKENLKIQNLFNDLEDSDQKMVYAIDEVVAWLRPRVDATIQLVENKKFKAANRSIKNAREELKVLRDKLEKSMKQLHSLRNEFMKVA